MSAPAAVMTIDWSWLVNGALFGFGVVSGVGLTVAALDYLVRKFGRQVL